MKRPHCGGEIDLHLSFDGDRVSDVKFSGCGCAISQSAASMMTQLIKGNTAAEIETMRERYREMIRGDAQDARALSSLEVPGPREMRHARLECVR